MRLQWRLSHPFVIHIFSLYSLISGPQWASSYVKNLSAKPGFRSVKLNWERVANITSTSANSFETNGVRRDKESGFYVTVCETQGWGQNQCYNKRRLKDEQLLRTAADGVGGHEAFTYEVKGKKNSTLEVKEEII